MSNARHRLEAWMLPHEQVPEEMVEIDLAFALDRIQPDLPGG
jgi:hypothetical protein